MFGTADTGPAAWGAGLGAADPIGMGVQGLIESVAPIDHIR